MLWIYVDLKVFRLEDHTSHGLQQYFLAVNTYFVIVVQLLNHVQLFATPWTVACQAPLSSSVSWNLLKFMSTESVMLSNRLILCCPQSFPASGSFLMSRLFASSGQSIGASASASVHPMNIKGWYPLGLTGLISLQSKELLRVFSSTTIRKHQFFSSLCMLASIFIFFLPQTPS